MCLFSIYAVVMAGMNKMNYECFAGDSLFRFSIYIQIQTTGYLKKITGSIYLNAKGRIADKAPVFLTISTRGKGWVPCSLDVRVQMKRFILSGIAYPPIPALGHVGSYSSPLVPFVTRPDRANSSFFTAKHKKYCIKKLHVMG